MDDPLALPTLRRCDLPDDVEKPAILDGRLRGHGGQGDVGHPQSSSPRTHSEIFSIWSGFAEYVHILK